jgi:hypothetical protein
MSLTHNKSIIKKDRREYYKKYYSSHKEEIKYLAKENKRFIDSLSDKELIEYIESDTI